MITYKTDKMLYMLILQDLLNIPMERCQYNEVVQPSQVAVQPSQRSAIAAQPNPITPTPGIRR